MSARTQKRVVRAAMRWYWLPGKRGVGYYSALLLKACAAHAKPPKRRKGQ